MSGFIAIVGRDAEAVPDATVSRMLRSMVRRGIGESGVMRSPGVTLAVQRPTFQLNPELGGPAEVLTNGRALVVCDAAVYYKATLMRRLGMSKVAPLLSTPAGCILALYEKFGSDLCDWLEGEYAFALWDVQRRCLVVGRDPSAIRPIYLAQFCGITVVASTIGAILSHPGCPQDFDPITLACDAGALLFSADDGTAYRSIKTCRHGAVYEITLEGKISSTMFWPPRNPPDPSPRRLDEAGNELRELLTDSVRERMGRDIPVSVWMSGGYDSPSIAAVASSCEPERVSLISASYPADHTGCENELIEAIAKHIRRPVHWIHPLLGPSESMDDDGHDDLADEPFRHLFPQFLHSLSSAASELGSSVVLTGHAGDFLFQSSIDFLSDLFRKGEWVSLVRELRGMPYPPNTFRSLVKHLVEPGLSLSQREFVGRVRGRPLLGSFERAVPNWLDAGLVERSRLTQRGREHMPRAGTRDQSLAEFWWYQTNSGFARLAAVNYEIPLSRGIEVRSPFHDLRVVGWAARAPRTERYSMGETKRALRESMRPLLPPVAVARRPRRTGTLLTTLVDLIRTSIPKMDTLFERSILAEVGVIDLQKFRTAVQRFESHGGSIQEGESLLEASLVESWLQARCRRAADDCSLISLASSG